jgi:hypothetical protein
LIECALPHLICGQLLNIANGLVRFLVPLVGDLKLFSAAMGLE